MMKAALILVLLIAIACSGPRGDHGDSGKTVVGPQGPAGSTGTSGSNGSNGTDGTNGSNGTNGAQGDPGTPGTIITWVQFCPGTTTYPTQFVEGGFCINNNLYAVYSINNGFLTLVPPGNYSSNAMNSSCSFTVLPNCQIQ